MAGITVKIGGVDKTEYVDARTLNIRDELTDKVNSASFDFICNDIAVAPKPGETVLIEEGAKKLFSGKILSKKESFLPPNLLKYPVECIDHARDLDRKLISEIYKDQKAGDIIKNLIAKYTITSISWMSPTSHLDEHDKWEFEIYAYDDNDSSYSFTPISPNSWGVDFLDLHIDEVICNKVRFKARFSHDDIIAISLYIYYESAWHKIYEGGYNTWSVWNEISLGGFYSVTRAAAVFYNSSDVEKNAHLHEFDFGVAEPYFTTNNVDDDAPIIRDISFDYVTISEAITKIAEMTGYEWYVDYDKDIHFFAKNTYPAPFQLDDDQANYKDLIINSDIAQLRNRIFIKSSGLEDTFGEIFIYDGLITHWTCKFRAEIMLPEKIDTDTLRWYGAAVEFSHNDIYLAVGLDWVLGMPYCHNIRIFKRDGDTFAKIADPDILPAGNVFGVAWSDDDIYLAVGHQHSPYITIYKRDGDTFTKLDNPTDLPGGDGNGLSFGYNDIYLAISHKDSPYITIYKRAGDVFTKLDGPVDPPTGDGQGASFSPDGIYLAIAHATSPYITIYKRSGDTFTKLSDPVDKPVGDALDVAFSPDGIYLAVGHTTTPFITIYKRDGDTFTKLTDPVDLPKGLVNGVAFAPNSTHLAVAHDNSPYMTLYKRGGNTFVKMDDPSPLPTGDGLSTAFSYNNRYIAIGHQASPRLTIYKHLVPLIMVDGVYKTVGWDGVDNPLYFDFMLNEQTKVLSIGNINVQTIDIGTEEGSEAVVGNPSFTHINRINPSNDTGKITRISIRAKRNLINCEVGIFYRPDPDNFPNKLSTRSTVNIGTIISGSKQIFDVNLEVVEGDYIGIYFTEGAICATRDTVEGVWWNSEDKIPCTNQVFEEDATYMVSLYGSGRLAGEGELAVGSEIMVGYTVFGKPICFKREDQDSIDTIKALEGGDGIIEFCLVDNNIDSIAWANEAAKADLLKNADLTIKATFITNRSDIKSGQIITLNSIKRDINQQFIVQSVELVRVDVITEFPTIPYKPADQAEIGYKPASEAEKGYRAAGDSGNIIYYIFNVTIANKFKKLEDLFIYLLNRTDESLK